MSSQKAVVKMYFDDLSFKSFLILPRTTSAELVKQVRQKLNTPNKDYYLHWSVGNGNETLVPSTECPWEIWEKYGEKAKFIFRSSLNKSTSSNNFNLDDTPTASNDVTEDDFDVLLNQLRFDGPGNENDSFNIGLDPFGSGNLPVCSSCGEVIKENRLDAFGMHWHKQHLACAICGKTFLENDVPVVEGNDGNAYCEKDFLEKFAPKCGKCSKPIQGTSTTAINQQWHPGCFTCVTCSEPFKGRFFEKEGKPYCQKHYYDSMGLMCPTCERPIVGKCVNAKGRRYHPQHFVCSHCKTKLGTGYFIHDDKLFCKNCSIIFYG